MLDIKRELDEIVAMYLLEDEMEDIYVEGPTDKLIFENYCNYKKVDRTFIEIDTINLSNKKEEFTDLDLKSNKNKLIALSRVLSSNNIKSNVKCIIDRDLDGILHNLEENKHLRYTDFSCLEAYLMCSDYISKFVKIGIRNFPYKPEIVLKEIEKVLFYLFIMRIINEKFGFHCKFPKIENNMPINRKTGACEFNFSNYIDIYINTNKLIDKRKDILEFVDYISQKLDKDNRFNLNGHDFVNVFFNYISKTKNTPNYKFDTFESAFYLSIQPNHLEKYTLFKNI